MGSCGHARCNKSTKAVRLYGYVTFKVSVTKVVSQKRWGLSQKVRMSHKCPQDYSCFLRTLMFIAAGVSVCSSLNIKANISDANVIKNNQFGMIAHRL